jgi:hypothetical protein
MLVFFFLQCVRVYGEEKQNTGPRSLPMAHRHTTQSGWIREAADARPLEGAEHALAVRTFGSIDRVGPIDPDGGSWPICIDL